MFALVTCDSSSGDSILQSFITLKMLNCYANSFSFSGCSIYIIPFKILETSLHICPLCVLVTFIHHWKVSITYFNLELQETLTKYLEDNFDLSFDLVQDIEITWDSFCHLVEWSIHCSLCYGCEFQCEPHVHIFMCFRIRRMNNPMNAQNITKLLFVSR